MPVNSHEQFRRHLLAGIDPMGGIVTSYLKSPQGQEMIRNYLSTPEGQQAICEFATSPKGREVMKQVLPGHPQLYVPATGSPGGSRPETQRNSLKKILFYSEYPFFQFLSPLGQETRDEPVAAE